ncbi:MAG: VIT family protein [Gammaproteobacteria bacterium]|nr:MAG: VIT family protein [Gammaproteobacteria bacterium]
MPAEADLLKTHPEVHKSARVGWLRAAVLGANDGIVSTASLIVGVAASGADACAIFIAGTAALVAGALSMAAGEYVSVSSQADAEQADLAMESRALAENPQGEEHELASTYVARGLDPALARQVAQQLSARDPLAAHAREEIGITPEQRARPLQAAFASATSFASGAALPLLGCWLLPADLLMHGVIASSLACLAGLGALAAHAGGAPMIRGALRVVVWSALAMVATALIGRWFDVAPT